MKKAIIKPHKEKIALLGLGLENQSVLKFLIKKNSQTDLTICDQRSEKEIKEILKKIKIKRKIKIKSGGNFNIGLEKFSLLYRSPGWPIFCPGIQKALRIGSRLSSPMNLFFQLCPSKNIIAISGSKGKGTTSTLIYQIIKNSGKGCFLGGNIGIAPLDFIDKIKKNDFVVLELSSFQLEDLNYSPKIAVLTNLFKEHLSPADPLNPNFHKSFKSYLEAKLNIALHQKKTDYLVANQKLKKYLEKYKLSGKIIYFQKSKTKSQLVGDFNQENIAAAESVAKILKINKKTINQTINNFSNLEHRLEFVRQVEGVNYFDNSFSTTPESTIADLKSFKKNIILLAGGADKGADFTKLAQEIKKRVKFIILFKGKGTERIVKSLKQVNFPREKIKISTEMSQAVNWAKQRAQKGDVVLLSTACASFGIFKNYKERGRLFQEAVQKL